VLDIIKAVPSIIEPPEVLCVFLADDIGSPLASNMNNVFQAGGLSAERANANRRAFEQMGGAAGLYGCEQPGNRSPYHRITS
jgi:hypothetical protein